MERQVNTWDRKTLDDLYDGVGSLAYDPLLLVKMVLYQSLKGRRSPAKWFEEAKLNEAMQWLGRGYTPARRTWYDFRDRVGGAVDKLHEQLIKNAIEQNLFRSRRRSAGWHFRRRVCFATSDAQQRNFEPAKRVAHQCHKARTSVV
ncbi:MAG: transposase [Planctomycetaceae bacterium]